LTILALKGGGRICCEGVLDKGEALERAEVLRGLVHILGNIDVLDGAVLLESSTEQVGRYEAREVARHNGLDSNSV